MPPKTDALAVARNPNLNRDLARAVLSLADTAGMPDSFWQTDDRIVLAREALQVPKDGRYSHSPLWCDDE